jgi:hypothetical protein
MRGRRKNCLLLKILGNFNLAETLLSIIFILSISDLTVKIQLQHIIVDEGVAGILDSMENSKMFEHLSICLIKINSKLTGRKIYLERSPCNSTTNFKRGG